MVLKDYHSICFKNTLKVFGDFKNKLKSVWNNAFWYVEVCFNTLYTEVKQILKKFPSYKINDTKNALIFISGAPIHYSFTFNLRFLYELKHKVCLSETLCGFFHFRISFVFIKVYIFVQKNSWTLWLKNVTIPFKIKIMKKPHMFLLSDLWFLSYNKKS